MGFSHHSMILSCLFLIQNMAFATNDWATYCQEKNGTVTPMVATYSTQNGTLEGTSLPFCVFKKDNGQLTIGLQAFASLKPSIAATYMKTLPEIDENSPLFQGTAQNPAYNVCQHLGGTAIGFAVSGGFQETNGNASDVCTFGDGSMVSAWTLIYMANHREGYDEVKANVRAEPLLFPVPNP